MRDDVSPVLETQNNCNWYFVDANNDESVIILAVEATTVVVVNMSRHW